MRTTGFIHAVMALMAFGYGTADAQTLMFDIPTQVLPPTFPYSLTTIPPRVAAAGDVNGDGFEDILLFGELTPGLISPGGYVVVCSGFDSSVLLTLSAPDDGFGFSASSVGDVDLDGKDDIVVGAPQRGGFIPYPFTGPMMYAQGYASIYSGGSGALIRMLGSGFSVISTTGTAFGTSVSGCGDLDHDGIEDVVVAAPNRGWSCYPSFPSLGIWVPVYHMGAAVTHSLSTGQQRDQVGAGVAGERAPTIVRGVGDFDGDGTPDWAAVGEGFAGFTSDPCPPSPWGSFGWGTPGGPAQLQVVSGAGGVPLLIATLSQLPTAVVMDKAGDADGDGFADVVVRYATATGFLTRVHAGPAGGILWTVIEPASPGTRSVAGIGDVNADGFDDIACGAVSSGDVKVRSGSDGSVLYSVTGSAALGFGNSVAGIGDINHDGSADFAVSSQGSLLVRVYSGRVLTSPALLQVGPGCASSGPPPVLLFSGLPRLGQSLAVSIMNGTPGGVGALVAGLAIFTPVSVGSGCLAYLDPGGAFKLSPVQFDAAGNWSRTFILPVYPLYAGRVYRLQAFAMANDLQLTDAWEATIGF